LRKLKKKKNVPIRAYENLEFLRSPDARSLRMLSEFLEPMRRFKKLNVRDTVVFFGSARTPAPEKAAKRFNALRLASRKDPSKKNLHDLEYAKIDFDMAKYYRDADTLAYLLTKWTKTLPDGKRFLVCSGGGPGMMEAANRGARRAGGQSIGLNVSLPFEQIPNPYVTPELTFEFHYFFMRKFWFAYLAKALVIFPGGFGTLDELFEILTLLQTKKVEKPLSIVIYGAEYWKEVLNFDAIVNHHMISPEDLKLFTFADTPEFAFEFLKNGLTKNYL
jgi:uncharacterized protein (TIGR00730 family)